MSLISELPGFKPLSARLMRTDDGWWHWCQGCNTVHRIPAGAGWSFNENAGAPTFSPSVKHTSGNAAGPTVCHYIITRGEIAYCDDCTHAMKGMRVAIPPLPPESEWYG